MRKREEDLDFDLSLDKFWHNHQNTMQDKLKIIKNLEPSQKNVQSSPIILYRDVEEELVNSLYRIKSIDLNKFNDPTFGKARGSDYKLFENNLQITNKLKNDLLNITKNFNNTEVFFRDSFFTILE